ncbi:ABC-three component system middle component 6 [uncultured Erythrobacter sp.]|uniref:ABC-three component system middle component 6 n=1 Tax=uncultured Erythrobacter sp. TaxID=263913 RepID=UPI0026243206|nr:ABC-three component system middle component 6 [uncultured Erythrobacter sp.]
MILPTKHILPERALLTIGAEVLASLRGPMTVSRVWDEVRLQRGETTEPAPIAYDWFVLALDLLFAVEAIEFEDGLLRKASA